MGGGSWFAALQLLSTVEKDTDTFNFQSNELFSKFLRQQKAISKFLSDAFRENTRCRAYLPSFKDTISGPFNYVERNGYFKILIGCVWGNGGRGGGLVALQSF